MDKGKLSDAAKRRRESKFLICFVGFGDVQNTSETISVVEMVKIIVPEAQIFRHNIFLHDSPESLQEYEEDQAAGNILPDKIKEPTRVSSHDCLTESVPQAKQVIPQNSASFVNRVQHEIFSSEWIHYEALELLRRIQEHDSQKKVLLAAYGFGGLVVKEAMIVANTNPCFYNLAVNVDSIFFSAVPGESTTADTIERQLLDTLYTTEKRYRSHMSQVLQGLVNSATQISYDFYRFAGKYKITRWVQEGGDVKQITTGFQNKILWPQEGEEGLLRSSVDDLDQLELLRNSFAPRHLLSSPFSGGSHLNNAYFEALKSLSQSRWILSETQTLENLEYFDCLHEAHHVALAQFSFDQITGGSIHVIGPPGSGKSIFAKFLYQKIIQESSLISINSAIYPQQYTQDSCWIYMDCIRQILSQKPDLFVPIQGLYAEILHHNIWSEEALKLLLTSILHHSHKTNFLIIMHNFDSWLQNMQSCWLSVRDLFANTSTSSCTLLTTSCHPLQDFPSSRAFQFDLSEKHKESMAALIVAKTRQLVNDGPFSISKSRTLRKTIEAKLLCSATLLKSPMSMLTPCLTLLFQRFTLSSLNSIDDEITEINVTPLDIFTENIRVLKTQSPPVRLWASTVLSWVLRGHRPLRLEELSAAIAIDTADSRASSVLSWVLRGHRPLHLEELSAAIAIDTADSNMQNLRGNISMAIEEDLKKYLSGFIIVEQNYVYLTSSEARKYLSDDDKKIPEILHLQTEEELVRIALHYITMVIRSELRHSTDVCLSGKSDHHEHADPDPVLGFMDYACRFWYLHFLRIETPSPSLKDSVVNFLNKKQIANKWFDLYLRNNGLTSYLLGEETIMTAATRQSAEREGNIPLEYSPLQIACYFGLTSLLSTLGKNDQSQGLQMLRVRHGHSQHDVVILQRQAVHYLSTASLSDDDQFIQLILKADADIISEYFPLHRAAVLGLSKAFKILFHKRGDLPQIDKDGRTPLHMAAICGSLEIISIVINGSKPEAKQGILDILDNSRETALITATRLGNFQAARLLVEAGTDIAIKNASDKTAIHYAVLSCPQLLRILVEKKHDALSLQDASGCTALHLAAKIGSVESIEAILGAVSTPEDILQLIDATDGDKKTALEHAAENGFEQVAKHLITKGKSVTSQEVGKMSYIYAAKSGHLSTLKAITPDDLQIESELLVEASGAGQLLVVHYLLQKGIPATQMGNNRQSAICAAASSGYVEIVRTLLRNRADINTKDAERQTPLHHAAKNGMYQVAYTLLNPEDWTTGVGERANINAVDSSRYTPLHLAAKSGNLRVVELLMKFKSDLSARSRQGETPLHLATKSSEIIEFLLKSGAEVNAVDISDQTPLHIAAQTGCLEAAQVLMRGGADTEIVDNNGKSPLYYAIEKQHIRIVEAILDGQSSYLRASKDPWLNLELAITQSKFEVFKYLIQRESNPTKLTNSRGQTLLHIAASYNLHEIVSYLIDLGIDVNHIDEGKRIPLHLAAEMGLVDNMKALLKSENTQVNKADSNDNTPLHLAAKRGHLKALSFLLDVGSDINSKSGGNETPLFQAVCAGQIDIITELLKRGADQELAASSGWCPLHAAADSLEITQLFIDKKANVNIQMSDLWTPLHQSIYWRNAEVAQLLLANGADPNIPTDQGQTPFHLSFTQNMEIIFFQYQGPISVDPNIYDEDGCAPIHEAVSQSSPESLKMFIDRGANLRAKAKMRSCLEIAVENRRADNLSVLLDHGDFSCDNPTWSDDDIYGTYWLAISKSDVDSIRLLVEHHIGLPQEISQDGLKELEAFVNNAKSGYDVQLFVKNMMSFGFNPFKRSDLSKRSAFELHITSSDNANEDFLLACIKNLDQARLSDLGFKELRTASEVDFLAVCKALQPTRKNITEKETDCDGWTIDHFLYQAYPRIKLDGWNDISSLPSTKHPDALILPTSWQILDTTYTTRIAIASNALEVAFQSEIPSAISLRSNFPFPSREMGQVYFEVTIQDDESNGALELPANKFILSQPYTVAIGFCGEFCDLTLGMVGWTKWSVGYHGDDGGIFHEITDSETETGHTFGPGDTVGCGINYNSGEYFFTLNGAVVWTQSSDIIYRKLYPVVAQRYRSCQIKVNFGNRDFEWAEANNTK